MDMVQKIVTIIGGIIGVLAAVGILTGLKHVREGMANDDSRTLDKGIGQIIVGGVIAGIVGIVVAYVISQLNGIRF